MKIDDFDDDVNSTAILDLVNRGLVEQFIDEDGEFVFELTEIGERMASDIFNSRNKGDV